jgi:hypothetical protein
MLGHETTSAPRKKTGRLCTAAFGVLLWASAHISPAGAADFPNVSPANALLDGYLRDTRDPSAAKSPVAAGTPGQSRTLQAQYRFFVRSSFGASAPVDASSSDLLARLHRALGRDLGLPNDRVQQAEREVLLSNSDALIRARVRLTLGNEQFGFVYADMGARDSALKWQGLAGIRGGHGIDLLGGWRHLTYRFTPGIGFDSLDFNGPYLGATFAW